MGYLRVVGKNSGGSTPNVVGLLSLASLEDKWNGWGLEENLFHTILDKNRGCAREDARHDARYLALQVERGIVSTPETRGQYGCIDARKVAAL